MSKTALAILILAFAFMGISDSAYLAQSAYQDTPLLCGVTGLTDCNLVAQSPYSHLFGIPLGTYGMFFYALAFTLAAFALYMPSRTLFRALYFLSAFGLLASIVFVCIQVFVIGAMCLYCLGSALLSLLIFSTARALFRKAPHLLLPPSPVVTPWQPGT